jgi:DNA-binding NarL/FixJ family response regulator
MPSPPLRVFLVDDHPVVLDGIRALVRADPGFELVGDAVGGLSALRHAAELQPDIAVLDLSMRGLNGLEVVAALLAACPVTRVIVLTAHENGAYLRQLLALGILGYVLKRSDTGELGRAIHAVAAGGIYLDPAIAAQADGLGPYLEQAATATGTGADLSAREIEVLRLAAAGHSNKVIAATLRIGVKSVDTYKARAMLKRGFQSRVDLIRFALAKGWLDKI